MIITFVGLLCVVLFYAPARERIGLFDQTQTIRMNDAKIFGKKIELSSYNITPAWHKETKIIYFDETFKYFVVVLVIRAEVTS